MQSVRPKKFLGQHFLNDLSIARDITDALHMPEEGLRRVLEIGPGMGVLTRFLLEQSRCDLYVVDIDGESIEYLKRNIAIPHHQILHLDFLSMDLNAFSESPFSIIGNFPYNISSQILFKVLEHKDSVCQVVGMFQKEVGERIASPPGKKAYGILSVFMQAWYDAEYLFTVPEHVFTPPPKVKSAVVRFTRKKDSMMRSREKDFMRVVKTAFNQRRKTLRNALKGLQPVSDGEMPFAEKRAEQLSWQEFDALTLFFMGEK
jgi:16S rRNA (adenine1518-N6/adenine1519-N6)-dimethyltransferase